MSNQETSILIVDNDEPTRRLLADYLSFHYTCATAAGVDEAKEMLAARCFNLVMTGIQMPGASGLDLCQFVRKMCPKTVVILMSRRADTQFVIQAMREGAYDYLIKPFDLPQVVISVERALRRQALVAAEYHYENIPEDGTNDLDLLNEKLKSVLDVLYTNYRATLHALAGALQARDVETRSHSDRVVAYCFRLGKELGLSHDELISLEQGALLHDIGKIGVPDAILLKPGSLTECERARMCEHVLHGLRIIDGIDFLSGARFVVGQHHEKYNGSGYPIGLRGDKIHINARIFAVADAFDAITSDRPYRSSQSYTAARTEIIANSGTHFDPKIVEAFLTVSEAEWAEIRCAAESQQYVEQIINRRNICSFILSLKRHIPSTGPLDMSSAQIPQLSNKQISTRSA